MQALLYILLSALEGFVVFYFAFSIFRINIKENLYEILITNIMISIATYFYSLEPVTSNLSPFFNMIAMILCLIFIFKISPLYSIFTAVLSLVVILVIQSLFVWFMYPVTHLSLADIKNNDFLRYTYQIGSDTIIFLLAKRLVKKGLWFSFISYNFSMKFSLTKINLLITIIPICVMVLVGITYDLNKFLFGSIIWLLCFINLLYMGIRMERSRIED
ncbi:hypothetical protein [Paenibacillus polymyxa]|uniref:hypothetical protein n=1 Tax=Paenibacillus polymyxa TaxID=1406 RepID=UPI0039BC4444